MNQSMNVLFGVAMLALGLYFGIWFASMELIEPAALQAVDSPFNRLRTIANGALAVFVVSLLTMLGLDYRSRGDQLQFGGEEDG